MCPTWFLEQKKPGLDRVKGMPKSERLTISVLSGPEQKEVSTLDKRTNHRKAFDRRRFVRDCTSPRPNQRHLLVCSQQSWSELRELVKVWSSP